VCSQKDVTFPYPGAVESMPYLPIIFFYLFIPPPSILRSSKQSVSLTFPHQNPVHVIQHICHTPCPTHPRFDHPDIWRAVTNHEALIRQLSPVSYYFCSLRPMHLPHQPLLECLPYSSLIVRDNTYHPCKAKGKFLYTLILHF